MLKRLFFVCLTFLLTGCDEVLLAELRERLEQLQASGEDLPPTAAANLELLSNFEQNNSSSTAENSSAPSLQAAASEQFFSRDACTTLATTTPRGLACLHCMQPEAQGQARVLTTLMLQSCLKNVATNFLVDGTFSFDEAFLFEQITKLTQGGRRLFVEFYITNGASQRQWKTTAIDAFGTRISPSDFRARIQYDPALQAEYQALVRRLIPTIRYARSRGAEVLLVPALEDNLSNRAFEVMNELMLEVLPLDVNVSVGRNACPNCFSGNEKYVPAGLFEEIHTTSAFHGERNSLITNDGRDYEFGSLDPDVLNLDDLKATQAQARRNNNIFILWSAKRQGLPGVLDADKSIFHPSERTFQIPSIAERRALIDFLKDGLP